MKIEAWANKNPKQTYFIVTSDINEPLVQPIAEAVRTIGSFFRNVLPEKVKIHFSNDPEKNQVKCDIRQEFDETPQERATKQRHTEPTNAEDTRGVIMNWAQLMRKVSEEGGSPDTHAFSVRGVAGTRDVVIEIVRQ